MKTNLLISVTFEDNFLDMTVNEERDIILDALDGHFGKHRVDYNRLQLYLNKVGEIQPHRIHVILDDLIKTGYIAKISTLPFHDYWITPQGEELMEKYGGFVKRQQAESRPIGSETGYQVIDTLAKETHIHINTEGGHIVGSPIGNQSRDFFLDGNNQINNIAPDTQKQYVSSNDKPKTFIGKILAWINNNKILCSVVAAIIFYFIKVELDKKYNTPTPTIQNSQKSSLDTQKKTK